MFAEPDLFLGCWDLRRSEGVGPDYDGEPQQRAGAVVHGHMVSDHLQVHDVLPGARQRLGEHQHGAHIAGTLQENMIRPYVSMVGQIFHTYFLKQDMIGMMLYIGIDLYLLFLSHASTIALMIARPRRKYAHGPWT